MKNINVSDTHYVPKTKRIFTVSSLVDGFHAMAAVQGRSLVVSGKNYASPEHDRLTHCRVPVAAANCRSCTTHPQVRSPWSMDSAHLRVLRSKASLG